MTEALAWLIEQPSASYDTSATTGSPPASFRLTRSVTSSPQVGLTWCTSASNGSRRPACMRAAVVVQDDLLVHRLELHQSSPTSCRPEELLAPAVSRRPAHRPRRGCCTGRTIARVVACDAAARDAAARRSDARPGPRCRSSSSTWPTSCGWMPVQVNDTAPPRSPASSGPRIRRPSMPASAVERVRQSAPARARPRCPFRARSR